MVRALELVSFERVRIRSVASSTKLDHGPHRIFSEICSGFSVFLWDVVVLRFWCLIAMILKLPCLAVYF